MHYKVRNIVFVILFLVLMFCTIVTKGLTYVKGVEFPEWMGVGEERSYLEGRKYETFPDVSIASLESGEFQSDFEQFMADAVPHRDDVMLLNASVQRSSIALASIPFGFDVYPTFYGSSSVYDSVDDSVVQTIVSADESTDSMYESAAAAYSAFAEAHSNVDYVFYRIDRVSSSSNNPTSSLVSNPVNSEYLEQHFFSRLGDEICVIDGLASSQEEIFDWYYRSDHHWTTPAAYRAYVDMLSVLRPEDSPVRYEERVWNNVPFYGSTTRSGLCPVDSPDFITDYKINLNGISVKVDGKDVDKSFLNHYEDYEAGEISEEVYTNRYAEYYHGDYALIEIHNDDAEGDDALLIVGDSFSNPMERFFSSSYRDVYVFDARHNEASLGEIIEERGIDDVAFIIGSTNFASDNSVRALSMGK